MNERGLILKTAAAAAIVAAVFLCVAAGGYALFVLAEGRWGAAPAAGVVALAAAMVAAVLCAAIWITGRDVRRATKTSAPPLSDYLVDLALRRPLATAALAAAAGWICLRNPRLVSLAFDLFLGGRRERDR